MPSRHISPESFDEILSDLGDDPAIQDPHGVRKSGKFPSAHQQAKPSHIEPSPNGFPQSFLNIQKRRVWQFIPFGASLLAMLISIFTYIQSAESESAAQILEHQRQISSLQKEIGILQTNWDEDIRDLNESIDSIEVSIHSLNKNRVINRANPRPNFAPFEAELKNWRYLGATQMRDVHKAFFHTGKTHVTVEKGHIVLGDWHLTQIDKRFATLAHPLGKTMTIQSTKSE